jgi:hypothetical protein
MGYVYTQNNPKGKNTGDCTVRAISVLTGQSWDSVYINLCAQGYEMAEMPSTNSVWGEYLRSVGYRREALPNTCPACYTIEQFCEDHPEGDFAVATGTHVVAVKDGDYYDAWPSGQEVAVYYFRKG